MISIDEFTEMADEITEGLPQEFFRKLNGGVLVLERSKRHPDSRSESPLYIMGQYTHDHMMGRYVSVYYGSFAQVYGRLTPEELREQLRRTIVHEFRHHLESLSGRHELEIEDAVQLAEYNSRYGVDDE